MWEIFVSDAVEGSGRDRRAYWTCGSICGNLVWRNGEWSRIFCDWGGVFGGVGGIRHVCGDEGRWGSRGEGMENVKLFKGPFYV